MDQDSELELKLISHITEFISVWKSRQRLPATTSNGAKLISLIRSMDLDSQPKPESKFMSLINQTVNVFKSMDLDSQPKPLSKMILYISNEQLARLELEFIILFGEIRRLEPEPELLSLIHQIFNLVISMNSKWTKLIPLCPKGKAYKNPVKLRKGYKWDCFPANWDTYILKGEEYGTYFLCRGCNGENHKGDNMAPVDIKHSLHPKHSLQLFVFDTSSFIGEHKCYCCDYPLQQLIYHCLACRFSINFRCVEKLPNKSINHPKWHQHRLALFPSQESVTCTLCALKHSSCPFYICPPCDFLVHQSCLRLPRVIKISCHPYHRISFTFSFGYGDWLCGVCRQKIHNDYGGYSCIKSGCSFTAHSKCATQENLWDGKELEGVREEIEEEVLQPFVKLSNGDIQYFSHLEDGHDLRLDENTGRDYDENKLCQACITPIYFGNFYSCRQCDFILHEACANSSRKIYHSMHPHQLTLVAGFDSAMSIDETQCSACFRTCIGGFFYKSTQFFFFKSRHFRLHVKCASISEPLVHESHMHPLYLTSRPKEKRKQCWVCKEDGSSCEWATFNCIECDFSLCFKCATLPHKIRYKHEKHELILSYGEETGTNTYWCEVCEGKINTEERFYKCDEYCCVTIHIQCLLGKDLYMKPGSSWYQTIKLRKRIPGYSTPFQFMTVNVLPNNQHMTRPICSTCKKRCLYIIALKYHRSIVCSMDCLNRLDLLAF